MASRAVRKAHSKLTTLDFRKADFGFFSDLLSRVLWDKALEGRGAQESWSIFKDKLLQAQEGCIPNKEEGKQECQEACKEILHKFEHKKEASDSGNKNR